MSASIQSVMVNDCPRLINHFLVFPWLHAMTIVSASFQTCFYNVGKLDVSFCCRLLLVIEKGRVFLIIILFSSLPFISMHLGDLETFHLELTLYKKGSSVKLCSFQRKSLNQYQYFYDKFSIVNTNQRNVGSCG